MGDPHESARLAVSRVKLARGRQCEDITAIRRDPNRVLELRRQRFIAGHCGPVVGQNLGLWTANIDHRLDCEKHALFQNSA